MTMLKIWRLSCMAAFWAAFLTVPILPAAENYPSSPIAGFGGVVPGAFNSADEMALTGRLRINRGQRTGVIEVEAALAPAWHVYALDQEGGPGASKLTLSPTGAVLLKGPFEPDAPPQVRNVDVFDVPLREHYGKATWSAPIELAPGVEPEQARAEVVFDGQICSDDVGCKPVFGKKIPIPFGGYVEPQAQASHPSDNTSARTEPAPAPTEPTSAPTEAAAPQFAMPTGRESVDQRVAGGPAEAAGTEFRAPGAHVSFRAHIEPATVVAGGGFDLVIAAAPDPEWHLYAYARRDPQQVAKPTLITIERPSDWSVEGVTASTEPIVVPAQGNEAEARYHQGAVTWTARIAVPSTAVPGEYELVGLLGYQTCTDSSCDRPLGARFTATVQVGATAGGGVTSASLTAARYAQAAELAAARTPSKPATPLALAADATSAPQAAEATGRTPPAAESAAPAQTAPLRLVLIYAFLGGLILNIMPCVLPVIGLKVLAFVEQAGASRRKVLTLNLWYSWGLMSVFMLLATLAVGWNVGWGQQFSNETVTITLAAIVFAMGLSFLGVWQMPIPGFVGSRSAVELAEREGPAGAFMKGVLTTILATPCSGPGIAVALGYCTGKPANVVYTIFGMVGLGMASPYLMIGAFPASLRLLPKPGMWMERFEQIMGLVLLATVIYLLSFTAWANVLPAVTLMLGLGAACWWIGRIPFTAPAFSKFRNWVGAAACAALIGMFAFADQAKIGDMTFYGLRGIMEHRLDRYVAQQAALYGQGGDGLDSPELTQHTTAIRWLPFSEERLQRLSADGRTVLIDFTADWCLTCKTLEATVLETQEVRDALRDNGVVALQADWTNGDPVISRRLESLGGKQVPVVAIFPAGRPHDPIVLSGFYTRATLLQKVAQAGPSVVSDKGRARPGAAERLEAKRAPSRAALARQ